MKKLLLFVSGIIVGAIAVLLTIPIFSSIDLHRNINHLFEETPNLETEKAISELFESADTSEGVLSIFYRNREDGTPFPASIKLIALSIMENSEYFSMGLTLQAACVHDEEPEVRAKALEVYQTFLDVNYAPFLFHTLDRLDKETDKNILDKKNLFLCRYLYVEHEKLQNKTIEEITSIFMERYKAIKPNRKEGSLPPYLESIRP